MLCPCRLHISVKVSEMATRSLRAHHTQEIWMVQVAAANLAGTVGCLQLRMLARSHTHAESLHAV